MAQRHRCLKFRVYAGEREGTGLFVQARVFETHQGMLEQLRAEARKAGKDEGFANATLGVMQDQQRYMESGRLSSCLGPVSLCRGHLSMEIITHEFAHAMFACARRKRLLGELGDMPAQEQCCYALGRMVSRFVRRANALGISTDGCGNVEA